MSRWENASRAHVGLAYVLKSRQNALDSVSKCTGLVAQIALCVTGAWLVSTGAIVPGALLAAILLLSSALAPLEVLASSFDSVRDAVRGYRDLATVPDPAVSSVTRG
jgi:ABC-type protease/lipase transport system fused ATPase/permease subunit